MKKSFFLLFSLLISLFSYRVVLHARPIFDIQIFQTIINLVLSGNLIQNKLSQLLLSGDPTVLTLRSINVMAGQELVHRYTNLGVTLLEALSWDGIVSIDPHLKTRLREHIIDLARWGQTSSIRTVGIIALSYMQNRDDLELFEEASQDLDIGIRYAVIEAMINWQHLDLVIPILETMHQYDRSLLIQSIAVAALVQYRPEFLDVVRKNIESHDWLIRSIAYKLLGEYGTSDDYKFIVDKIPTESFQQNKFTLAEMIIAALNLFPLQLETIQITQETQLRQIKNRIRRYKSIKKFHHYGPLHLDPLIINISKMKEADELLDPRINTYLLDMLKNSMEERFSIQDSNSLSSLDLYKLSSVHGIRLKSRYSILGILISEGLKNIPSSFFRFELQQIVQNSYDGKTVQNFAAISLAHSHDPSYFYLFQRLFDQEKFSNKFAAIESLRILNVDIGNQFVLNIASSTDSSILQVYAAYAAWMNGKKNGRDILYRFLNHQDSIIKAMAIRYIGELGSIEDYSILLGYLNNFEDSIVQAELCVALLKLFFGS